MNTNTYPFLTANLKTLRLPAFVEHYQRLAETHNDDPRSYLAELAALEVVKRHEACVKGRIAKARFPIIKTIESFDFSKQPQLPKGTLLQLFDCQFIEQQRSAIFLGKSGTGKTHCLIALGLAACMRGYRVAFYTAADLLLQLLSAKRNNTLEKKLKALDKAALLCIDELGFIPADREATDLLFTVIASRYERKSIALTSNLLFEHWTKIFADELAAAAVVDRLVHHGAIFQFTGESYRLRSRDPGIRAPNGQPETHSTSAVSAQN